MTERTIRNMQVPAYCPIDSGIHAIENNGVVVDVKNVIAMLSIPIILAFDDPMSIELIDPIAVAIAIPDMVLDAASVVDMDIPDIDMIVSRKVDGI